MAFNSKTFLQRFRRSIAIKLVAVVGCALVAADAIAAQASDEELEELALQLANPVAALISVPFQLNYDQNIGPADDGDRWTLNILPVVPFELSENWNLISRTILPVMSQDEVFPGAGSQTGIGDVNQTFFFSPKRPVKGWIYGVGPAFLFPTGSNDLLTLDKWAAGPAGVALKQQGHWTFGALAKQLWSFAGDDDRADVNVGFLQPFLSYTTSIGLNLSLQSESVYDWNNSQWNSQFGVYAMKVMNVGGQMMSIGGGIRYWAETPQGGADGLGVRFNVTLLFPKKGTPRR